MYVARWVHLSTRYDTRFFYETYIKIDIKKNIFLYICTTKKIYDKFYDCLWSGVDMTMIGICSYDFPTCDVFRNYVGIAQQSIIGPEFKRKCGWYWCEKWASWKYYRGISNERLSRLQTWTLVKNLNKLICHLMYETPDISYLIFLHICENWTLWKQTGSA